MSAVKRRPSPENVFRSHFQDAVVWRETCSTYDVTFYVSRKRGTTWDGQGDTRAQAFGDACKRLGLTTVAPALDLEVPPTRTHRQLAAWINAENLTDSKGRRVVATVEKTKTNTDGRIAGTRFLRKGRGRRGLKLEIWPRRKDGSPLVEFRTEPLCQHLPATRLYEHDTSQTYRRHDEARRWVSRNLRRVDGGSRG
jgi:hypothetical protein